MTALKGTQVDGGIVCGGGARADGRAAFGYALLRGKRPAQEDCTAAAWVPAPDGSGELGFFGVFDGHGGPHAANFAKEHLLPNLLSNLSSSTSDAKAAITEAFERTDADYIQQLTGTSRDDGCTAVAAVLMGQRLLVANAGDSRCVLARGGKAIPMSVDHKPNLREERARIEGAGGVVVWAGTWRVSGVLAVSRAIGDRCLKRFVVATPDVREEDLTAKDDSVILATDGVWDVMSNDEAAAIVSATPDPQRAVTRLVEEAYSRGSLDNISAVVCKFKF